MGALTQSRDLPYRAGLGMPALSMGTGEGLSEKDPGALRRNQGEMKKVPGEQQWATVGNMEKGNPWAKAMVLAVPSRNPTGNGEGSWVACYHGTMESFGPCIP